MAARKKRVSFKATKLVKRPTRVSFRAKDGSRVSFKATKLVRVSSSVSFLAKKRKKKK